MIRLLAARLFAASILAVSACTADQVADYAAEVHGLELTVDEAAHIADWIDTDCLPDEDGPVVVECAIRDAAAHYRLPLDTFTRLIWCESRLDPAAVNAASGATGPAQFLASTWDWVDELGAPWTHLGRTDPRANVFTAAWLIDREDLGGWDHWNASRGCWL